MSTKGVDRVSIKFQQLDNWDLFERIYIKNTPYFSDGTGYVDDGREIFDDDLEDEASTGQSINLI